MTSVLDRPDRLAEAMAANTSASNVPHVVVALPSFSVGDAILTHYGERLLALEHRYLVSALMTHRLPHAELVFVSGIAPDAASLDCYRRLGPQPERFADGVRVCSLDDRSTRSVAAKILSRPDLVDWLRRVVADRPAVIEPWNVTDDELAVAEALDTPINGTLPRLRHLGFKSEGRRLFRRAGVPVPYGSEDVRTTDDVVSAVDRIAAHRPLVRAVVIKHDDSGAGDGNVVLDLTDGDTKAGSDAIHRRVAALPEWYLADLRRGGVVEELVQGERFSSPSAQLDIAPDGRVDVLATHEQQLGGDSGQVFMGCRFPADPAYAAQVAQHALAAGRELAAAGVVGRASVDFAAACDHEGRWRLHALEVNLRKGGTTHPYCALRNLVPGRYDTGRGEWLADADGGPRAYVCSDNLVDDAWLGLDPAIVVGAVREAGLEFDHQTGTGVVLHMLSGLAIDGRCGLTSIATDGASAQSAADAARDAIQRAAAVSRH
jgi:hypothetical protein